MTNLRPAIDLFDAAAGRASREIARGKMLSDPFSSSDYVTDIVAAPLRGIEGAVQGTYGFLDMLTADSLPDYDRRFLGESQTAVGGAVEGVSNFLAGFIPIAGGLGKIGALSKLGRVGRGAVAGFTADFVTRDGNDPRLSNLLERYEGLRNPVTEFLAASDDDSEALGRFKNALEGLALGTLTDSFIGAVKAVKTGTAQAFQFDPKAASQQALAEQIDEVGAAPKPTEPVRDLEPEDVGLDPAQVDAITSAVASRRFQEGDILNPRLRDEAGKWVYSDADLALQEIKRNGLNLTKFSTEDDALAVIRQQEVVLRKAIAKSPVPVSDQLAAAASDLSDLVHTKNPELMLARLQEDVASAEALVARTITYKAVLGDAASLVREQARLASQSADPEVLAKYLEMRLSLGRLVDGVDRLGSAQGRGLAANKIRASIADMGLSRENLDEFLQSGGGAERVRRSAIELLQAETPEAITDLAKQTVLSKSWAVLNEYYMNALLSNPKSVVSAFGGGIMTSAYRSAELMFGAALRGDRRVMSVALSEVGAITRFWRDSAKFAKQAFATNESVFDLGKALDDSGRGSATSAAALGLKDTTLAGQLANFVSKGITGPSRAFTSADEFVKQLTGRSILFADIQQKFLEQGLDPATAAARASAALDEIIVDGSLKTRQALTRRYLDEAASKGIKNPSEARQYARKMADAETERINKAGLSPLLERAQRIARENTASTPLDPNSMSGRFQAWANTNPLMRTMFFPFIRTPVNLATWSLQRMDLITLARAQLSLKYPATYSKINHSTTRAALDVLSGDPYRKAEAMGRLAMGTTMAMTFYGLASAGVITGKGPTDPDLRKQWLATGALPYSVKIGDKYYSYDRFDPLRTVVGTFADMFDYARWAPQEDQEGLSSAVWAATSALTLNFTNKTYLAGLRSFVETLADPQKKSESLAVRYSSSFVPSLLAQSASALAGDDTMREVRGLLEGFMSRTPGLSDNLMPVRNILGEPVKRIRSLGTQTLGAADLFVPMAHRSMTHDVIFNELMELGHAFQPPRAQRAGVDLRDYRNAAGQTAHDRWQEITGSVRVGGRQLRFALEKLIQSPEYRALPVDPGDGLDSPRITLIQRVLNNYRNIAWRQLSLEFPDMRRDQLAYLNRKQQVLNGSL